MPQVSTAPRAAVIMPAYNAAATIEKTVRSILAQTMGDLRLVVVNDGSKDETAAILARLAAEDPRLVPLTVENGGPARARNIGIDTVPAGTEFILFSDADDLLAPDALEYAIENAQGADLALLGFSILNPDGSRADYCEPEMHLDADSIGAHLGRLYKANLLNQVWAKLFRASLILDHGIRFQDYRWGEDRLFIYDCLAHASRLAVLPACKYTYIMYPGESLITKYYAKKPEVCIACAEGMDALCRRFGVTDRRDFNYMFMKSIFSCLTTLFAQNCPLTHREKRAEIRRIVTDEAVRSRSREVFGGFAVKALCAVVRTRNVTLNHFVFWLVSVAGAIAPKLFTRLKHQK